MTTQNIPVTQIASFPVIFTDSAGDDTTAPETVSFVSSDPSVATVTYDNRILTVTPLVVGSTTITASPLSGELDVVVVPGEATAFTLGVLTLTPKP